MVFNVNVNIIDINLFVVDCSFRELHRLAIANCIGSHPPTYAVHDCQPMRLVKTALQGVLEGIAK